MKIPSRSRSRSVGFDMTPMIDVVFQLIIFFLVASSLSQQESLIPLKLPVAASGQRDTPDDLPSATINVLPDRSVTLAGKPVAIEALQARLTELRRGSGADVRIRIRLDRELPYEALEPALVACAKAEIWNVQISVFREEASR